MTCIPCPPSANHPCPKLHLKKLDSLILNALDYTIIKTFNKFQITNACLV